MSTNSAFKQLLSPSTQVLAAIAPQQSLYALETDSGLKTLYFADRHKPLK